jgi:hypothetical protein
MTRREAAMILGLRESAAEEKIKDAHRRIMIANHPDSGGVQLLLVRAYSSWSPSGLIVPFKSSERQIHWVSICFGISYIVAWFFLGLNSFHISHIVNLVQDSCSMASC